MRKRSERKAGGSFGSEDCMTWAHMFIFLNLLKHSY
jgi:hypothetical protein